MAFINDIEIKEYLCTTFAKDVNPLELSNDYNLITNGLISSLELLIFISWVGEKFNIPMEEKIFSPDNFSSVSNVIIFINQNTK